MQQQETTASILQSIGDSANTEWALNPDANLAEIDDLRGHLGSSALLDGTDDAPESAIDYLNFAEYLHYCTTTSLSLCIIFESPLTGHDFLATFLDQEHDVHQGSVAIGGPPDRQTRCFRSSTWVCANPPPSRRTYCIVLGAERWITQDSDRIEQRIQFGCAIQDGVWSGNPNHRLGHSGILDPKVTGCLIVWLDRARAVG